MTTPAAKKFPCITCGKAGLFICRGCSRDFCLHDASQHRQALDQQMDEVMLNHDQLRQTIIECTTEPRHHPLLKQIDEWEQESINKIHQAANDARKQILLNLEKHTIRITLALEDVKQQLSKAHDDDEFFEPDLEQWKKKLTTLEKELREPSKINTSYEEKMYSFISKIIFNIGALTDFFYRSTDDIQIQDDGSLITHGSTTSQAAVRGRDEYFCGVHRFHFKIEQLAGIEWAFFGIVSKDAPLQTESYATQSSYGWAGKNQVYINGIDHSGFSGYKSDLKKNDMLVLLLDCDQRIIRLNAKRTKTTYSLNVDENKCPFPWQLNLNLYNNGDSVRILPK